MSELPDFPDLLVALLDWAEAELQAPPGLTLRVGTTLHLPNAQSCFARVRVVDIPNDGVTQRGLVDLDFFAPDRQASYDLGRQADRKLVAPRLAGGVLIDSVLTVSGPKWAPWDNTNTVRTLATYRISTRR